MRARSETIGRLGRVPARQGATPPSPTPPSIPPPPTHTQPPEKGAIRRWVHGALFDNLPLKFLSMVLAVTVFLVVNDDKDREITVRVGVSYVLPEDKVLVSDRLDEVRVTIRGKWSRLRRFDERELSRISVDLRGAPADEIVFTEDMVQAPSGLTVAAISPHSMRVAFDKRTEKVVEVSPVVAGRPQHGYVALEIKALPATVKVRGAQRLLAALSSVRTREVSLEGRVETFSTQSVLVPPEGIELAGIEQVSVEVKLDQELVTRKLPDVVVALRGDGVDVSKWRVTPQQVEVTLTGALLAVEKTKDAMTPVVRITPADRTGRDADITIEGVPPGIGVRISPERVKLAPVK